MSAQNTLYELPREYGIDDDMITDIEADELRSALVFIIYMRLLDDSLYKDKNAGEYDGYLYQYLVYGSCVNYAYHLNGDKNDLYLFSHAGMKLYFIEHDNTILDYLSKISLLTWNSISKSSVQSGGAVTYKDKVKKCNTQVNELIKYILNYNYYDNFDNFEQNLQKIIAISVPAYQNSNLLFRIFQTVESSKIKETNTTVRHNLKKYSNSFRSGPLLLGSGSSGSKDMLNITKLQDLFPIMSPIDAPMKEDLSSLNPNGRVINVFGHTPMGFGYTFSKTGDSDNSSLVITTDFSNGFMKSNLLRDYDTNYLLLSLNLNKREEQFHLYGDLKYSDKLTQNDNRNIYKFQKFESKYFNNTDFNMNNEFYYNYRFNLDEILKTLQLSDNSNSYMHNSNRPTYYNLYNGQICNKYALNKLKRSHNGRYFENIPEFGFGKNTNFGFGNAKANTFFNIVNTENGIPCESHIKIFSKVGIENMSKLLCLETDDDNFKIKTPL